MSDTSSESVEQEAETTQDFWKEMAKESKEFIPKETLRLLTLFYLLAFIIFGVRCILEGIVFTFDENPDEQPDWVKWVVELMLVFFVGAPSFWSDILGLIATWTRKAHLYAFFYWTHILLLVYFLLLVITCAVFIIVCNIMGGVLMKSFPWKYPIIDELDTPLWHDPVCFRGWPQIELVLICLNSILMCIPTVLVIVFGKSLRRNLYLARINKANTPF